MEALEKSTSCQEEQFNEEFGSLCEFLDKASNYLAVEANETTIGQSSSSSSAIIGEKELNEDFKSDEIFYNLLYSTESPKQNSGLSSNSNELDPNAETNSLLLNECVTDDSRTKPPKHPGPESEPKPKPEPKPEPKPKLKLEPDQESDNQVVEEHQPTQQQQSAEDNLESLSDTDDPIEQCKEVTSTSTQTSDIYQECSSKIQHSKLTFPCQWECGRSFKTIRGQKRHEMFCKTEDDKLKCDICDKVFTRKFTRDSHRLIHVPEEKKDMRCPQCKIQCTTTRSLLNHKAIYTRKISYPCKYCNQIFCYQYHLDRHTKLHHSSERKTKET